MMSMNITKEIAISIGYAKHAILDALKKLEMVQPNVSFGRKVKEGGREVVTVCVKRLLKSDGQIFEEGSAVLIKHKDLGALVCTIETITENWVEITTDDGTFDISVFNIISIDSLT